MPSLRFECRHRLRFLAHDGIRKTREVELTCPECLDLLDLYTQRTLNRRPIEPALALVQEHLDACPCCTGQFKLVLETLRQCVPVRGGPAQLDTVIRQILLGRLDRPEAVDCLAAFLTSVDENYVTVATSFIGDWLTWNYEE